MEYSWKENDEYEFKHIGKTDFFGSNLAFRFVDDFVMKSVLDEERAKKMFEVYVDEYIKPKSVQLDEYLKLESHWYISTEEVVEEQLEKFLKDLGENKYDVKFYVRFISLLLDLEEEGFSQENTRAAILKMKENIEKLTYHIYLDSGYCSGSNEKKREKFKKIINELQDTIDRRFQVQMYENIELHLLEGDGWAENLVDYVRKNKKEINSNSGFLSQMDMECLATKIYDSKSYDIHAFRACILEIYVRNTPGNALKEDGERIDKLLAELEKLDKTKFDRIKKMQIKYLVENLKKAKESYKS